jgi:tetratricopeptide (TPR) repeat protein
MARTERASTSLIDLPATLQAVAAQRRTGVLTVGEGALRRLLHVADGRLVALSGGGVASFAKALAWSGVVRPEALRGLPHDDPVALVAGLRAAGAVTDEALLDAVDCWIEEDMAVVSLWRDPVMAFADGPAAAGPWPTLQHGLGVAISPNSLLLETLRRQDELGQVADRVPAVWDLLVRDAAVEPAPDAGRDLMIALRAVGDAAPARAILEHALLSPFRAVQAVVALRQAGLVRVAGADEVVVRADSAFAQGDLLAARGLYQRALDLGTDHARIRLALADLAERSGDAAAAAGHFRAAAGLQREPAATVMALRNALRLGADAEPVLLDLARIYREQGEKDDLIAILLRLAGLHEERRAYEAAVVLVTEASELGGDPVASGLALARLAAAQDDPAEQAVQLGLAARAAQDAGRDEDAIAAWTALLGTDPGLTEPARSLAQLLARRGQRADALRVLRSALAAAADPQAQQLAPLFEQLTNLDPNDATARDWLARTNLKRQDRAGAVHQLVLKAESLTRSGDVNGLVRTYESIIAIDAAPEHLVRLAEARLRLGQESVAAGRWGQALDALVEAGDLAQARRSAQAALERLPGSLPLRLRLARITSKMGDRAGSLVNLRAAANLAAGGGDKNPTPHPPPSVLVDICKLRPDDLVARIRLAAMLEGDDPRQRSIVLKEVVRCAMAGDNRGIALDYARRRVSEAAPPAIEEREALIALLNRFGDDAGEVAEGRRLLDDLLVAGELDRATGLLARLVASQPQHPDLVLQLAEIHDGQGDSRQAARFYRHAVPLLQVAGRTPDALAALGHIERLTGSEPGLILARSRAERGVVIDWEKIRSEFDHRERLRRAEELGAARAEDTPVPPNRNR